MDIINTCFNGTIGLREVANYTHLLPLTIGMVLSFYIVFRKGFKLLPGSFFLFSLMFSLWLLGDVYLWTGDNYNLVSALWHPLDFINVLVYITAVFFFDAFALGNVSNKRRVLLFLLPIPAFIIAMSGDALVNFNHPFCEATENSAMTYYKIFVECISILLVVFTLFKKNITYTETSKKAKIIAGSSLIFTLLIFATTEFLSTVSGIYEISLFSLFVIPIYQFTVIFLTSQFNTFNLKNWNQQVLAFVLVIMVGSQLFFTSGKIDLTLNLITLIGSFFLVYFLDRSIKIEIADKARIEELAKSLEAKNEKLRELDMQKSEFISLASHQLRGPLTAIKGYASMLMDGDFGELGKDIKEAIDTIFKSTQALVVIVGDYLDISRIEQGKMKYDFTEFDLNNLVERVVKEMTPAVTSNGLKFTYTSNKSSDFVIRADEGKIKQVISNLIDNSSKYTKTGSIEVSLERDGSDNIMFRVKDTGIGIPPEVLSRLFERFSRAPDASKTNIMGTGLGLYVARKIIEAHRGKIWAESKGEGKGAKFTFEIEALHGNKRPVFKDAVTGE